MYYNLASVLKRRLLLELCDSFARHPIYKKIVPDIQNRFAVSEMPQYGIVVEHTNASKVQLAGDNFLGTINSHVMLAYVDSPQFPIEWVKEDEQTVRQARGSFPSPPGVYFLEIEKAPEMHGEQGTFVIEPLFTVPDEPLLLFQSGIEKEAQLQNVPSKGTLRLFENGRYPLIEGRDYTVNYDDGSVMFQRHFQTSARVTAEYRYPGATIGPVPFYWNTSDSKTLPGVTIAFGKRAETRQRVAIVVYADRTQTAEVHGGKFEVSFDAEVIARDPEQKEEIADLVVMYLNVQKKSILELEGIEVVDVSIGGESETPIDETGKEYSYSTNVTIQLRADWEMHLPMPLTISKVTSATKESELDPNASDGLQRVANGMFYDTFPIFRGRNNDYERIT